MSYALLIIEREDRRSWPEEVGRSRYEQMHRFGDALKDRGICTASQSLRDMKQTRIEIRGGKQMVVDGPFAEAKEIVGGFFLLDVDSREDAIAIARECPATQWATVEVREVGDCWPPADR